jgi:small GTP-binding protein
MNDKNQKFSFKITVIGDGGVGKTSLIRKFTQDTFSEDYIKTIGAQFSKLTKIINGDLIKIIFWDIAGQNDLTFLRPSFYRNSKAAIIVYSLEENELGKESIENARKWSEDVQHFCGAIPLIVFANKVDLVNENAVKQDLIQDKMKNYNFLGLYITSAKTGQGVVLAFERIIEELYHKFKKQVS